MRFPETVDRPKMTKKARAQARLKYMLSQAAFARTGSTSMRKLAKLVHLDYSTIYLYIRKGAFSETCAAVIECALGTDTIKASHLTNPLAIDSTK